MCYIDGSVVHIKTVNQLLLLSCQVLLVALFDMNNVKLCENHKKLFAF